MNLRILIIDDHYLLIEGYKATLREVFSGACIVEVYDCESAYNLISEQKNDFFDLVFLDISLPPFLQKGITSGGDLAILIRKNWPETKILVATSHPESIMLYDLNKSIYPEGLMVKCDFTVKDLKDSLKVILNGERFLSKTARRALMSINSKEIYLDNYNRQIITFLAKGIRTKNMHKYLSLSISAIDKRKAQIKDYFLIAKGNDEDIIREARKAGFI